MTFVRRERIALALGDSLDRGIALIIAPAGYGKTEALLGAFPDTLNLEFPEGIITMEAVARGLMSAAQPRSMSGLAQILQRERVEGFEVFLAGWLASRLRNVDVPIVVDDFQRIDANIDARRLLIRVIEASVPKTRWLIASRETPDLPIGTWLARDYMRLPVADRDLAFTLAESRELTQLLDVEIPDTDLQAIVDDAEGWPLVVSLALSAWNRTRALAPLRIRTNAVLFQFIETEVWAMTGDDDRLILLAAALLHTAQPAILGLSGFHNSAQRLERIEKRIPLVRRMRTGEFRLHELFREFIISRYVGTALHANIVDKLSAGIEKAGLYAQALALSARSEAWDRVTGILAAHGYLLIETGDHATVSDVIARIPRTLRPDPVATALRGVILHNQGKVEAAATAMQSVIEDPALPKALKNRLQLRLAQLALNRGDPGSAIENLSEVIASTDLELSLEAVTLNATAHAMLGQETQARAAVGRAILRLDVLRAEVKARVLMRLALALRYLGDYAAAETRAIAAAELADANGMPALAARAFSVLQDVAGMTHPDTTVQYAYARSWVSAAKESGEQISLAYALIALIALASDRADDDLYDASLSELRQVGAAVAAPHNIPLRWVRAIHDVGVGRLRDAILAIRSADVSEAGHPAQALMNALEGLLLVASAEHQRSESLLQKPVLMPAVNTVEARQHVAYAHMYRTLGLWLSGKARVAQRLVVELPRDLPERDYAVLGIIRSICSSSRATMTHKKLALLTSPLLALDMQGHARFLMTLVTPSVADILLSPAEIAALKAFKLGGTYQDVANRLGSERRAIEKRVEGAIRKIGCSGRNAAVAYAEERGWLD